MDDPTYRPPQPESTPDAPRLRVAFDSTALLGRRTGVGEFCASLLGQLAGRPGLDMGAFAMSRAGRKALAPLLPEGAALAGRPGPGLPARLLHLLWSRGPWPSAELLLGTFDVVHGTNFVVPPARAATVVTVHDLSPLHYPQWAPPAARAYPALVKAAVDRGAWVHADSAFVAREVVEMLGVPAERVRAVHLGATVPATGPEVDLSGLVPGWATRYVLAVSRSEPRKDLPTLVRAFATVGSDRPDVALVIAGPQGAAAGQLDEAVAASPARRQVVRLGWVSDAQRDALIQRATVLAYPSLYEGFGLPPLQAMAVGTPVVATDCGALREVLGDAALLVPPGDAGAMGHALGRLLDEPDLCQQLVASGRQRAAMFSWSACADGIEALYREAVAAH